MPRIPTCAAPRRRDGEKAGGCDCDAPQESVRSQQVHDPEMGAFFGSSFPLT